MKKQIILIILLFSLVSKLYTEHGSRFAIGIIFSGHNAFGFSIILPFIPIIWGIYNGIGFGYSYLSMTGDFYLIEKNLLPKYPFWNLKIDTYIGVGGYFDSSKLSFDVGLRIPVGLSIYFIYNYKFYFSERVEAFFEISPEIGVKFSSILDYEWYFVNYSAGVRWWF